MGKLLTAVISFVMINFILALWGLVDLGSGSNIFLNFLFSPTNLDPIFANVFNILAIGGAIVIGIVSSRNDSLIWLYVAGSVLGLMGLTGLWSPIIAQLYNANTIIPSILLISPLILLYGFIVVE